MSVLLTDCPRCGAKHTTFDIYADIIVGMEYGWQTQHEVFGECRHCHQGTIFSLALNESSPRETFRKDNTVVKYDGSANDLFRVLGPITIRDVAAAPPPEHVPADIAAVFTEGASSLAGGCFNAAGAMFRLALDMATKRILPVDGEEPQPNREARSSLSKRLDWLFGHGRLPRDLEQLAETVRHDGNDAAHDGTLSKADAEDLLDFATALL